MDLGFYISIGKRAIWDIALDPSRVSALRRVIEEAPMEKLLIETDSSEPAEVRDVAQKIAELRGSDWEKVGDVTASNLKSLLRL